MMLMMLVNVSGFSAERSKARESQAEDWSQALGPGDGGGGVGGWGAEALCRAWVQQVASVMDLWTCPSRA